MRKQSTVNTHIGNPKRKRPGRHSKKRTSNSKKSKHYKKSYVGQGR